MATHSSTVAWTILWTEELGRLQSTGSQSWTRLSDFSSVVSTWASLIAQLVKNLPAIQETLFRFLGREDPLEKK